MSEIENQQLPSSVQVTYSCGHDGVERLHRIKAGSRSRRIQWLEDYGLCRKCRLAKISHSLYLLGFENNTLPALIGSEREITAADQIRLMFAETCLTPYLWRHIPVWSTVIDIRVLKDALESVGITVESTPITNYSDPVYREKTTLTFGYTSYYADDKYHLYFLNKSICRYALRKKDIAIWWITAKQNHTLQSRLVAEWADWLLLEMTKQPKEK